MSDYMEQMTREQLIQNELLQFEEELKLADEQKRLFDTRHGMVERNAKKYGLKMGKWAAKHVMKNPLSTYRNAKSICSIGPAVHGVAVLVLDTSVSVGKYVANAVVPEEVKEKVTAVAREVNNVVDTVAEAVSPVAQAVEDVVAENAKWLASEAAKGSFSLFCDFRQSKMRRVLEYSLRAGGDRDYEYLGDLDAYQKGVSIVNNRSLDEISEEQRQGLVKLNRQSYLKLNSGRKPLGTASETDRVTDYSYLKEMPSFVIPRQEGFWGKLNIVDYFRHKSSEKKARESADSQDGTLESRVMGFKAIELSEKEKEIFTSGFGGKLGYILGRATKGGKALAEHKKLQAKVERSRLVYQKDQIESYTKLHSRLSDKKDLLTAGSLDVADAYREIMLEKKDGVATLEVSRKSLFYTEQNVRSADKGNNPVTKAFESTAALFEKTRAAMSDDSGTTLDECLKEYRELCSQQMSDGNAPLYQSYFRTERNIRVLKGMPRYAQVLLMACVSQRLFDAVNHYGYGKNTVDLAQFGKLAANYRLSRLAADAIVSRRDFQEAFSQGERTEAEKEQQWINTITDTIQEKAGPEYAGYIAMLKSENARTDEAMKPVTDKMIELGAANGELNDALIASFYAENIEPLILSMPSKEAIISDYIKNYKKDESLGIPEAENLIAQRIKESLGAAFVFGKHWQGLLELNALGEADERKQEYLPAVKSRLDAYYTEDAEAKLIVNNYSTRSKKLTEASQDDTAGVLAVLEKHGYRVPVSELMKDEKYAKMLTRATDAEFENFHGQLLTQLAAAIEAVHSVMDMTNVTMRINERKVIHNLGLLMLSGSVKEIRMHAAEEFKKLFKGDVQAPAIGQFLKVNLTEILRDNDAFRPYQEQLITRFLREYEKDEKTYRSMKKADLQARFALWAQGFNRDAGPAFGGQMPNSIRFENELADSEAVGEFLRGRLSLTEVMDLLRGAEGFEYLSDLHGDTEHLNAEEYAKLRDTVIERVGEFVEKLREEGINEAWLSHAMSYRCIKASLAGIDYAGGIIDVLEGIQREMVRENVIADKRKNMDPAVYQENLNLLDGLTADRMPVSVKIFQPFLMKDDSFVEAMSEGDALLEDYADFIVLEFESLFDAIRAGEGSDELLYGEDIISLYINVNAERLAGMDLLGFSAQDWKDELKNFHRELGQRVNENGKSFDELMKEGSEDREYKPGEKIAILSMLVAADLVKYTDLYDVKNAEKILSSFKEKKRINLELLTKADISDTELYNAFRQRYGLAILTEDASDFEARLKGRIDKCRLLIARKNEEEKDNDGEAEEGRLDPVIEEEIRREVEAGIKSGRRVFSDHFCIIEGGRMSFYREQSPLAIAFRKVQSKTEADLNEEQKRAFEELQKELVAKMQDSEKTNVKYYELKKEYTPKDAVEPEITSTEEKEEKARAYAESVSRMSVNAKLFGELSSLQIANGGGWITAGNYQAVLSRINEVCAAASDMLRKKFEARIAKASSAEEKAKQERLYQEELYRFMVYLTAQKKLELPQNQYNNSILGKTAKVVGAVTGTVTGTVSAVARGFWNLVTWTYTDYSESDVTKRMEAEHDSYRMVQAQVNRLEKEQLRISDMDLHAKLSDELICVQLEMFKMSPEEFCSFINQRIHYYEMAQHLKDTVNEIAGAEYEYLGESIKGLYCRSIGNNMLLFLQDKIRATMPKDSSFVSDETMAANKEAIAEAVRELLGKDKKEYYLKAFNSEMTRSVINREVLEERATVAGDVGMSTVVTTVRELGDSCSDLFDSLSLTEQKALILAVTLPIRFTDYDKAGSLAVVKSGVNVTETGEWESLDDHAAVSQKEIYRIIDMLKNNSSIEGQTYRDASIRLWTGDTPELTERARSIFYQCYSFIVSCRNMLDIYDKKDWKKQPDNADSILLAKRLGISKGLPEPVNGRDQFAMAIKQELGEDNELVKRLENCGNFSLLITALQNRSMLDESTTLENSYANEILRRKTVERFTQKGQAQKLSEDMRNSSKTVYITQALYALYSFQKKDETLSKTGTLLRSDLAKGALERTTAIDTGLLASALDFVDAVEANKDALAEDFDKTYADKMASKNSAEKMELSDDAKAIIRMMETNLRGSDEDDFTVYVDRSGEMVDRLVSDFNREQLAAARANAGL